MNIHSFEDLTKTEMIELIKQSLLDKKSLEYLLDSLNGISWEFDLLSNNFNYVSPNAKKIMGYDLDMWSTFESWAGMVYKDDREKTVTFCDTETREGRNHAMEYRMVKKSGEIIWVLDIITLEKDENNHPIKLFGFILDITDSKIAQIKAQKEHKYLHSVINGILDPIMIINADYSVNLMNESVKKRLKGKTFLDPSSPKCYEISHNRTSPCDTHEHICPLQHVLKTKEAITVVHNHKALDGADRFMELAATPLFDEDSNCIGIIEAARDITAHIKLTKELKDKTELLNHQAHYDYLTNLPNRVLFMDRLEQGIRDSKRNKTKLALFFMDLDHFKEVNDTLGHDVGDKLLQEVAKRFQKSMRENDTLSRLGGDEFTVIMKNINNRDDISILATKLIDIFKEAIYVDGHILKLSNSIGISIYPDDDTNAQNLLKQADIAMYKAKDKGKNNFQFFS